MKIDNPDFDFQEGLKATQEGKFLMANSMMVDV